MVMVMVIGERRERESSSREMEIGFLGFNARSQRSKESRARCSILGGIRTESDTGRSRGLGVASR